MSGSSDGGGNSPFAWLGLLKWSLAYADGTGPSTSSSSSSSSLPPAQMSEEDRAFLELVMKEGIIDEGERMKVILKELTCGLGSMLGAGVKARVGGEGGGMSRINEGKEEEEEEEENAKEEGGEGEGIRTDPSRVPDVAQMLELFDELRDIVEQIDYARAFMAMGGVHFLLGLATHRDDDCVDDNDVGGGMTGGGRRRMALPDSLRRAALRTLSTMCQNNPPVQSCMLSCDHVRLLVGLFLDYSRASEREKRDSRRDRNGIIDDDRDRAGGREDGHDLVRCDVVRALSSSVREFPSSERAFCECGGDIVLGMGLGMKTTSDVSSSSRRRDAGDDNHDDDDDDDVAIDATLDVGHGRPSTQLRKRSIFLLRALLTSDDADEDRHTRFDDVISFACTNLIDEELEEDGEIREMCLSMMTALLRQEREVPKNSGVGGKGGVGVRRGRGRGPASDTILRHKDRIGSIGVNRIRAIRDLVGGSEEMESAALELEEWENLLVALAEARLAEVGNERSGDDAPTLVVCDMYVP